MRLFPAHAREAKQWARALCDAFHSYQLPLDWRLRDSPIPTLQQTQELMANAMGYSGWRELSRLVALPHSPVYLESLESDQVRYETLEKLVRALASQTGLDYAHGHLWKAVDISGVGFTPKTRRDLAAITTPWGLIEEQHVVAEGIRQVSTSTHGGWILSPDRQARMPEHLRRPDASYEEDGEFWLVVIAFPEEPAFQTYPVRHALAHLGIVDRSYDRHARDDAPTEMEARVLRYLADCVRSNRLPIRFPKEDTRSPKGLLFQSRVNSRHNLSEWVGLLEKTPTEQGRWATRPGPWYDHWVRISASAGHTVRFLLDSGNGGNWTPGSALLDTCKLLPLGIDYASSSCHVG